MSIVSSSYTVGHAQRDGRRYVTERHTDDDGGVYEVEYLAPDGTDYQAVMQARATAITEQLAAQLAEETPSG